MPNQTAESPAEDARPLFTLSASDAQLMLYMAQDAIAYAGDLESTCRADGFYRQAEQLRARREAYERIKRELPRLRFRVLQGGRS